MKNRFKNKVCLITGGGSGIGRATCIKMAAEGGQVIVIDINEVNGKETVSLIKKSLGEAYYIKTDIGIVSEVKQAVANAINKWKRIDVLINNAAIMTFKGITELDERDWDNVINVNLRSVFLFCKYCIPFMNSGVIVNTSSVHAHQTSSNMIPYATSKGGMEAFTRALSREFPPTHVRVNCVAPGGVDTPLLWSNPSIQNMKREDVICSKPDEIADIICFIASDEALIINGTTIIADNGLLSTL